MPIDYTDEQKQDIQQLLQQQAFNQDAEAWLLRSLGYSKSDVDARTVPAGQHNAGVAIYQQFLKNTRPEPVKEPAKPDEKTADE